MAPGQAAIQEGGEGWLIALFSTSIARYSPLLASPDRTDRQK
jgi:hypothetical protein